MHARMDNACTDGDWRDGEGWQERETQNATEYFRLVEGEGFCCRLYKQPLMKQNGSYYTKCKLELLALTPSNNLDVSVHATSV